MINYLSMLHIPSRVEVVIARTDLLANNIIKELLNLW